MHQLLASPMRRLLHRHCSGLYCTTAPSASRREVKPVAAGCKEAVTLQRYPIMADWVRRDAGVGVIDVVSER